MRRILFVLGILLGTLAPAAQAAPVFDDPRSLMVYAYLPYESGNFPEDPTELFSPTLMQLWEESAARSEEAEIPNIDFDPYINAQDYDLSGLTIADPVITGDEAMVAVAFENFGEPQELRFWLVRVEEGWKIDDIESMGGDYPWRLSELLAADPLLN